MLGLRCWAWAFSGCGEQGLLFVAVCGLLIVVASLCCRAQALGTWAAVVVACGLSICGSWVLERRLSSHGTQTQLLCGMWDLPGPGLELVSPALAGGFLTTAPPGKSLYLFQYYHLQRPGLPGRSLRITEPLLPDSSSNPLSFRRWCCLCSHDMIF